MYLSTGTVYVSRTAQGRCGRAKRSGLTVTSSSTHQLRTPTAIAPISNHRSTLISSKHPTVRHRTNGVRQVPKASESHGAGDAGGQAQERDVPWFTGRINIKGGEWRGQGSIGVVVVVVVVESRRWKRRYEQSECPISILSSRREGGVLLRRYPCIVQYAMRRCKSSGLDWTELN